MPYGTNSLAESSPPDLPAIERKIQRTHNYRRNGKLVGECSDRPACRGNQAETHPVRARLQRYVPASSPARSKDTAGSSSVRIPQTRQLMCSQRSIGRWRVSNAPTMTHKNEQRMQDENRNRERGIGVRTKNDSMHLPTATKTAIRPTRVHLSCESRIVLSPDDSAKNHPCRCGRLLRLRGAARQPAVARATCHCRLAEQAVCCLCRIVRGPPLRSALGHAGIASGTPVPHSDLPTSGFLSVSRTLAQGSGNLQASYRSD